MTALDRLMLAGDDRVGAIAFGSTPERPILRPSVVPIRDLADIESAMVRFDAGETVERDISLMANGTSMGGARPKATIRHHDGSLWIAKFRRKHTDVINVVKAEHASMTLAKAAGIDVAETEIAILGENHEALLVRRFDRGTADGLELRYPYLSALSLTDHADTDLYDSYMEIADRMRLQHVGCLRGDLVELYRRMVFNAAIGNTDDHLKNHALLRDGRAWRLSPAYDIVPNPEGDTFQAISVGRFGTTPSYENILSECGRFGLRVEDAAALIIRILDVTAGWREPFSSCGLADADLRILGGCIGRLTVPGQRQSPTLR